MIGGFALQKRPAGPYLAWWVIIDRAK